MSDTKTRPAPKAAVNLTENAERRVAELMQKAPDDAIGVEDDFTAGFVFDNPNAKGACGCGESFMV